MTKKILIASLFLIGFMSIAEAYTKHGTDGTYKAGDTIYVCHNIFQRTCDGTVNRDSDGDTDNVQVMLKQSCGSHGSSGDIVWFSKEKTTKNKENCG